MKLITSELEQELISHEANPTNILDGRRTLEKILTYQFRRLADGLFAHLLLQNSPELNKIKWWYHYLSELDDIPAKCFPDYENSAFATFCARFAQEVANGQIRPITPADLNVIEIKIFGGYVYLWDDVRINKQLTHLGSAFRLVCVGSHDLALNHIQSILGRATDKYRVDSRFIFGRVGPVSASPLAPIFDFEREYAVSPYLADWGGGFNYEKRIVIRQLIIKIGTEEWVDKTPNTFNIIEYTDETDPNKSLTANEYFKQQGYERVFLSRWQHALYHEAGHLDDNLSYLRAFWQKDIMNDLCRFTESPKSNKEIRDTFEFAFGLVPLKEYAEEDSPPIVPTLDTILETMKAMHQIVETSDGKLQSLIFENREMDT